MTDTKYVETVERTIPAPPEAIFALIADPSRHQDFDGSGTVREAPEGSTQLALGDTFAMSMKAGISYSMINTVVEFEPNRRLAWQTRGGGKLGMRMAGRIWRYELEPVVGGTLVRESWDLSEETGKALVWRARGKTRKNMDATLERIEQVVTT